MRIFLTGFMGSGKTYTGKRIAQAMNFDFLDLDELITDKEQMSIAQIFDKVGEGGFRKAERSALLSCVSLDKTIIATGGGTPCFFDNLEWMKSNGIVIYLEAAPNLLVSRLRGEMAHRPLIAGMEDEELHSFIQQKLEERSSFYEKSHIIYEQSTVSTSLSTNDLVDEIIQIIGH